MELSWLEVPLPLATFIPARSATRYVTMSKLRVYERFCSWNTNHIRNKYLEYDVEPAAFVRHRVSRYFQTYKTIMDIGIQIRTAGGSFRYFEILISYWMIVQVTQVLFPSQGSPMFIPEHGNFFLG